MNEQPIQCVGIIMDGNRRWARAHNKSIFEGHSEGYKKLQEAMKWAREAGIFNVVAYAFSTENWQRSEEEVGYLMKLFRFILDNETKKMIDERVRVCFIGDRARFPEDIQKGMERMEETTAKDFNITLHLAMSYGGRAEIVSAVNTLLAEGRASDRASMDTARSDFAKSTARPSSKSEFGNSSAESPAITEDEFSKKLWSYPMPDPDLVIRTGGARRLSNFLPWQTVYSELFFVDAWWPDFSQEEFGRIIGEFGERERRMGR